MLNEYEQKKYDTISKFVSKEIDLNEVMRLLNLKECQIYRLKKKLINEGKAGFIHKNRGKTNPNKKDDKLIEELENLYLEKHYYKMLELENRDSVMIKESEVKTIKKEHHKVIPPANHPWRKNMTLRH